eukprot:scaffold323634_cov86-Cyclotella_meneghiniana.AAC.1
MGVPSSTLLIFKLDFGKIIFEAQGKRVTQLEDTGPGGMGRRTGQTSAHRGGTGRNTLHQGSILGKKYFQ